MNANDQETTRQIALKVMGWAVDKNNFLSGAGSDNRLLYPPAPAWSQCSNTYFLPLMNWNDTMEMIRAANCRFELVIYHNKVHSVRVNDEYFQIDSDKTLQHAICAGVLAQFK